MGGDVAGCVSTLMVAAAVSAVTAAAVVARGAAHVDELGRTLTELLAAENYEQALHLPGEALQRRHNEAPTAPAPVTMRGTLPGNERTVAIRRMRASFLFLRTPSDGAWLGFRDVTHVNGRRVDAARRAALDVPGEPDLVRWHRLSEESARFNLGTTARTINAPTFALVVLQAQNHARFALASSDAVSPARRTPARHGFAGRTRPGGRPPGRTTLRRGFARSATPRVMRHHRS